MLKRFLRCRREVEQLKVFDAVDKWPNIASDFQNLDVA